MSDANNNRQQDAPERLEPTNPHLSAEPGPADDNPAPDEVIRAADFTPLKGAVRAQGRRWRPVHGLLAASFLLLALVAGFLFSARSVLIQVQPAEASVAIDGGLYLPVAGSYLMLAGDYELAISAPGYHPRQQTIVVGDQQNQSFSFSLDKLPGHLTLQADIEEAGEVWIDGERAGSLNSPIANIEAGEHRLQIITERYKPFAATVEITGMDQHQEIPVELQPAWADVEVSSNPPGAELRVDGELVGTTPLSAQILEGERHVSLKLPGYKSWQNILEVDAGESLSLPPVSLERADGLILVQSSPAEASITVAGKYYGLTPAEVALPPGQRYQITLFKEGFEPAREEVAVESGREQTVKVELQPRLGKIAVKSAPADALLYVDGRLMGRANQTLSLPARQASIAIRKEGYADYQTTVLPRPNFDQSLNVELKTLEEAKWEHIEPQITTAAGQTLKLFRPDVTFTMGSSRREQGRRANEAMRDVQLSRAFYLGTHEVTNREFRQFAPQHSSGHAKGESLNGDDYPAVQVSWQQAALYANWLSEKEGLPPFYQVEKGVVSGFNPQSTGYRLPTEAEWAWAARYHQGEMLKYPWGNELPPTKKMANIADRSAASLVGYVQPAYDDGHPASAPVGSFPANDKGIHDLAGNVAEWVHDFYEIAVGLSAKAEQDPLGPASGSWHVIRGSSWAHGSVTELRLSFRDCGEEGRNDLGFRLARFVE